MSRLVRQFAVCMSLAVSASTASGQIFSGVDVGGGIGGTRTNSDAAHAAWAAAMGGPTFTQNFEAIALGSSSPINLGGGITLTSGGPVGSGFDLNQVTASQDNQIGYNTTAGGSRYFRAGGDFGFANTVRFSFGTAVSAFGVYITGVQNGFGITTASWGGNSFQLGNTDGNPGSAGVQFFGFVAAGPINFIDFTTSSLNDSNRDIVGFDDVQIGATVIPEPSTVALMLSGLLAVGVAARRRRIS